MITTINEFKGQINEKVINLFQPEDMHKYADEVWNILQKSYAKVPGGFLTAKNVEDLINKTWLWKLVKKDNKIIALKLYKFSKGGRKAIAGGTDGSIDGKKELLKIMHDDINLKDRKSWAEASGATEVHLTRLGAIPIPNKYASELLDKEILSYDPDGYHYIRTISGIPTRKIMMGNIL